MEAGLEASLLFFGVVVLLIAASHALPSRMCPGSRSLVIAHVMMGALTAALFACVSAGDPYPFSIIYSFALMVLCVECWFTEDPQLFNGSKTGGWPFFLFRRPGAEQTMAPVPMAPYTRIFSAWHAGGVCLCFFMHVLSRGFPSPQKAVVSLALGLLWIIWAAINSWRVVYGGFQFCQIGLMFHSLVGPGCGLCGYWHLAFWASLGRGGAPLSWDNINTDERVVLGTFVAFVVMSAVWLLTQPRRVAGTEVKGNVEARTIAGSASPLL